MQQRRWRAFVGEFSQNDLKTASYFDTNAPPFEIRGCIFDLGGAISSATRQNERAALFKKAIASFVAPVVSINPFLFNNCVKGPI